MFPFFIVHSNVWGLSLVTSLFEFKYVITFVDNYSRATWIYLLKSKSDVATAFKSFCNTIQFNAKLYILQFNNSWEYLFNSLSFLFDESRIVHQTIYLGTPKQNGVAKCKNRHLLEISHAIMFTINVPKTF